MRAFFLLALLALAASVVFAQYEDVHGGVGYEQCQEEQLMMGSCRDYLKGRCTASMMPITWPWKWGMSSCQALRQRCCQQLRQTAPQCRCKAICRTIQGDLGGLLGPQQGQLTRLMQRAKSLPSMCNMYPSYCNIPTTGGCY